MNQALTLTPEKIAFIHGAASPQEATTVETIPQLEQLETLNQTTGAGSSVSVPASPDQLPDRRPSPTYADVPPVLVPLTTRLLPTTAEALRRAHLGQKLKRLTPSTQQEIVEEALATWLRDRGFLEAPDPSLEK
jgi:hypothetical protein